MFATFAIITAVCVLANIAYSVLLTPQEILQSDAVAVVSFQAFIYMGETSLDYIVPYFGIISAHVPISAI